MGGKVGIIANPASGKDIRRLVAFGSVFDNEEKVSIVPAVSYTHLDVYKRQMQWLMLRNEVISRSLCLVPKLMFSAKC